MWRKQRGGNLFSACQSTIEQKIKVCFLNSGYGNHMTVDETIFLNMDNYKSSQVKMRKRALLNTKIKGIDEIQTKERTKCI